MVGHVTKSVQMLMKAIILAGGQGIRLKPYTVLLPKALVPLGDVPILEIVLQQLQTHGITDITLAVGHMARLIEAYFGDGRNFGVQITYSVEDQPLGTAGPLKQLAGLPDDFLVMNTDILCDINYQALFNYHRSRQAAATIAVYRRTVKMDFGTLELDPDTLQVQQFIEKPILEHSVCMGIYVFNRVVLEDIPPNQPFELDELIQTLIRRKHPVYAFPFNGYWQDIGRVADYETVVADFEAMRTRLLPVETTQKPLPNP